MEISAQEIIALKGLIEKKLARIEVSGEIYGDSDERVLNIKRASFCQYSGKRDGDCEYSVSFDTLRGIRATCEEQIVTLTQQVETLKGTIEAVDGLLPQEKQSEKPAKKGKAA